MALFSKSIQESVCNGQSIQPGEDYVNQIFDEYCSANTFKTILKLFDDLCSAAGIDKGKNNLLYNLLKLNIKSWKAQNIWNKLDKKLLGGEYGNGKACVNTKVFIIGCGPCGLRVAIEAALLGCKVIMVEKRDGFTRNNVLHLWPFLIHDLKSLGAKHFFGKFCSGSIDHISIRTLQCILLKVALILGVEVHARAEFVSLVEPVDPAQGWSAHVASTNQDVPQFTFDVCISADGKRNTMPEFKRKEFRGKLAIAITANFINHKTKEEASVEEISGVSYIFNQKFFKDLSQETGIDLENIVYYKDETHYFVMTAKKQNLLTKKVLVQDFEDPEMLLGNSNVDQQALMLYAIRAAEFSTNYKLTNLKFAHNQYGQPDVSMFDFTSMFAAENACRVVERNNKKLLLGLVGDTLLEPFWPTGSGCARGFLSALDAAWMIRSWSSPKMSVLDVISERESIYQLLSQTTPENLNKNYASYTIDPSTRYMNLNVQSFHPQQVRCLFDGTNVESTKEALKAVDTNRFKQYDMCEKYKLMRWCQTQLESYEGLVRVVDMYSSWKNGLALSALIHRYRPELIDVYSLDNRMAPENIRNAIKILEEEFGISAEFDAEDLLTSGIQVENLLTSYLLQFRDVVSQDAGYPSTKFLAKDVSISNSENKQISSETTDVKLTESTVSAIAQNFSLKSFDKPAEGSSNMSSNLCYMCGCRVYLVQRLVAEGFVFHRNCFRCSYCLTCLHKDYYSYNREENQFFCKHHFGLRRPSPTSSLTKSSKAQDCTKSRHRPPKKSKISERAEYTTESELGENEDDQTRHNLISLSSATRSEPDISTSEEELQFLVDDISDEEPDFAWAQIAKLCSSQSDEKVQIDSVRFTKGAIDIFRDKVKTSSIISLDSTSDAETVGGSDADWETDTEMDEILNEKLPKINNTEIVNKVEEEKKPETIKSICSSSIFSNRMAFFSAPAQPVRIDARTFLGLGTQPPGQENVVQEPNEEVKQEEYLQKQETQELDYNKSKNKVKAKRKPKKFTKKRKKDDKVSKKDILTNKVVSIETSSGNNGGSIETSSGNNGGHMIHHVSPNYKVSSNDKEISSTEEVANIQTEKTELSEKVLDEITRPEFILLSDDSGKEQVDELFSKEEDQPSSIIEMSVSHDIAHMFATSIVDEAIVEAQHALQARQSDDYSSSSEAEPATIMDPSHGLSSSEPSMVEHLANHKIGSSDINENRRLSHRSTSYDSCLKLSAAIDSLLESNHSECNISPAVAFNSEVENASKWRERAVELCDNRRTLDARPPVSTETLDKPVSKDSLSMSSIASTKSLVSPSKFSDAKRRFFYEAAQPVRIDHRAFFGELAFKKDISSCESHSRDVMVKSVPSNGWVSNQNILRDKPAEDLITMSDSKDNRDFIKESESVGQRKDEVDKKDGSGLPFSPFDSSEEIKQYSDVIRAQQEAPSTELKDNYFSDPETTYKIGFHKSSTTFIEMRKKEMKTSENKDKRRSFLSKIIQLKHEKKDKGSSSSCRQTYNERQVAEKIVNKEKTNSLPLEKRKQNKRKIEKGLALKPRTQGSKSEGIGQSVYEEMAPIMEGIKKVQQRNKGKNSIKERVQDIAPPSVKTPTTNLVPPKADLDDFETESEIGEERLSLWSLHSQNEKMANISEEENSRQRKKQLRLVRRKHKEKELGRMHAVQEIMNKLEEIEIQQQQVEERGVQIERILRGEKSEQEKLLDEVFLIQEWFNAIQEMNFLNRHESELIVQTRELELEDKQYQLQLQLQETILQDDMPDRTKEQEILQELVDVVEKRDKLVLLLEEERLKHRQYDRNLQKIMEERGFSLSTYENNLS